MDGCVDEGMDIGECMHTWTDGWRNSRQPCLMRRQKLLLWPKFMTKLCAPNCEVLPFVTWAVTWSHQQFWFLCAVSFGEMWEPWQSPARSEVHTIAPLPRNWFAHLYLCLFFNLSVGLQYFCHIWDLLCWGGCLRQEWVFPWSLPSHQSALWKHSLAPWICSLAKSRHLGCGDAFCSSCIFDLLNIFLAKFCICLACGKPPPSHKIENLNEAGV